LNNYCNLFFVVSEAAELQIAIAWFVMFCPMALSKCPLPGAGPSGGILHVQHQWSLDLVVSSSRGCPFGSSHQQIQENGNRDLRQDFKDVAITTQALLKSHFV